MLTPEQKSALQHVYQLIAPDIPSDYNGEEIAELIIDGSKLTIYGYTHIDKEISDLARVDYPGLLRMIARELHL